MSLPVWLITGASSGFGLSLTRHALKAGVKVIACTRNASKAAASNPDIPSDRWLEMDLTSTSASTIVRAAITTEGRIDALINNAGMAMLGALEDFTKAEMEQSMDVNFYAPARMIQTVLPFMREQKGGCIVNMSSAMGLFGAPSRTIYAASKFALEGMSEALVGELAPFGIRVLAVEPGAFKTNFAASITRPAAGMSEVYKGTVVQEVLERSEAYANSSPGDPDKAAEVIIRAVQEGNVKDGNGKEFMRLVLGSDCMKGAQAKKKNMVENIDAMMEIAKSTDF